jgi:hypothetical protein
MLMGWEFLDMNDHMKCAYYQNGSCLIYGVGFVGILSHFFVRQKRNNDFVSQT